MPVIPVGVGLAKHLKPREGEGWHLPGHRDMVLGDIPSYGMCWRGWRGCSLVPQAWLWESIGLIKRALLWAER